MSDDQLLERWELQGRDLLSIPAGILPQKCLSNAIFRGLRDIIGSDDVVEDTIKRCPELSEMLTPLVESTKFKKRCKSKQSTKRSEKHKLAKMYKKKRAIVALLIEKIIISRSAGNRTGLIGRGTALLNNILGTSKAIMDVLSKSHGEPSEKWSRKADLLCKHQDLVIMPMIRALAIGRVFRFAADNHVHKNMNRAPKEGENVVSVGQSTMVQFMPIDGGEVENLQIDDTVPMVTIYDEGNARRCLQRVFPFSPEDLDNDKPNRMFTKRINPFAENVPEATTPLPSLTQTIAGKQLMYGFGSFLNFKDKILRVVAANTKGARAVFVCHDYEGDTNLCKTRVIWLKDDFEPLPEEVDAVDSVKKTVQCAPTFHLNQKLLTGLFSNPSDLERGLAGHMMAKSGEAKKYGSFLLEIVDEYVEDKVNKLTVSEIKIQLNDLRITFKQNDKKAVLVELLVEAN